MSLQDKMRIMRRCSLNGYETAFSMHYLSNSHYRWELIRYPLDAYSTEPTEILMFFEGRFNWDKAITDAEKYLNEHPEDGFWCP